MNLRLYSYWRSSSAWRVRIALGLKGLAYQYRAVDLPRRRAVERGARGAQPDPPGPGAGGGVGRAAAAPAGPVDGHHRVARRGAPVAAAPAGHRRRARPRPRPGRARQLGHPADAERHRAEAAAREGAGLGPGVGAPGHRRGAGRAGAGRRRRRRGAVQPRRLARPGRLLPGAAALQRPPLPRGDLGLPDPAAHRGGLRRPPRLPGGPPGPPAGCPGQAQRHAAPAATRAP